MTFAESHRRTIAPTTISAIGTTRENRELVDRVLSVKRQARKAE